MSEYGTFAWNYYYLRYKDGKLVNEDGIEVFNTDKTFATPDEAEQWMIENNERGNVIGSYEDLLELKNKYGKKN